MPEGIVKGRTCIIGWPVAHSRSPLIHNYWLRLYGLEGEYIKHPVSPSELADFIVNFSSSGFIGCNVTIPHKEKLARLVHIADPATGKLGAVNTVFFSEGSLMGTNTDGYGFISNLKMEIPDFKVATHQNAMVLGAGGAARAVVGSLIQDGVKNIWVCNRSLSHAQSLAELFDERLQPLKWADAAEAMGQIDLLVNATSLGMTGEPQLLVPIEGLKSSAIVCDIVYVPLETQLLRRARLQGNPTVDGLGMLLHQARPAFEKWYGVFPDITPELRRMLEEDIRSAGAA